MPVQSVITPEDIKKAQEEFAEFRAKQYRAARLRAAEGQHELPGIQDHEAAEAAARAVQQRQISQAVLSGDRLYTAQVLILAGLPIRAPETQEPVRRKARLADGSTVSVIFSPNSEGVPLPYGSDRLMIYFLTTKAVMCQSNVFRWNCVDQFIQMFNLTPDSGGSYRRVQERFIRVAYMNITIEVTQPRKDGELASVSMISAPLIDGVRLFGIDIDEEGKWLIPQTPRKMLNDVDLVRVGGNFYHHLLYGPEQAPIPIPMELFRNKRLKQSARLLDYGVFLYYRSFAGATDAFIPWASLAEGFEWQDPKHMIEDFRRAQAELSKLPSPFNRIRSTADTRGLYVNALPQGTAYFEGQPKKFGPLPVSS